MTKEEKELLLKDLCARLSYGVTIYRITDNSIHRIQYSDIIENIDQFSHLLEYSGIDNIKPYLRPMDSMTEEERNEIESVSDCNFGKALDADIKAKLNKNYDNSEARILEYHACSSVVDWLNAHHFDYHGLIEMGLALEAPKGIYNN